MTRTEYLDKVLDITEIIYPRERTLNVYGEKLHMLDAIAQSYNYIFVKSDIERLDNCLNRLADKFSSEEDKKAIQKLYENEYNNLRNNRNKNFIRFKATCKSIANGKYNLQEVEAQLVMDRLLKGK